MSKTEELKLTEEQEAIIDIWDAESDVNTRRIDWVNFAKEILTARPSPPVAIVSALKTKDEISELAKICAPDDGTWFGTAQDSFVNGYFHGRKEALVSLPATRMPSKKFVEAAGNLSHATYLLIEYCKKQYADFTIPNEIFAPIEAESTIVEV